jgi:hypothetical protein
MKSFRLPEALQASDDGLALSCLRRYYKERPGTPLGADYTGARFDNWNSSQTRTGDTDRNCWLDDRMTSTRCWA